MIKAKYRCLFVGLVLALFAAMPLRAAAPTPSNSYVVLVGINQYGDKQIKPRLHAEADAKALYDLFTNKDYLGVEADRIRLLLGSADPQRKSEPATRENVIKALNWVATNAGRDDLVIFAFIGEGAPLSESGRLCYLAVDSTLKERTRNAIAAGDIQQELDKLKSQRFCAFIDVNFNGFDSGPVHVPEATFGSYREFRGADGKEDQGSAPGRAVFLASDGLSQSPDLENQGLFTQVLLDGLKGAADKEGYGADGLVTVDELVQFVDKELLERQPKLAKKDELRLRTHVFETQASHFVVTYNPSVGAKVSGRVTKLGQLADEKKISSELALEGRRLLSRMPKLKAYQDLRREYERFVDGEVSAKEFGEKREALLASTKMKHSAAESYAKKVLQATEIIRDGYVKETNQGELIGWAIRGLYRQVDETIPADIKAQLERVRDMTEADLTALLARVREHLGKREDLDAHKDIDYSLQRMLAHLDPYTTYIDPEMLSRFNTETTGKYRGIGISIRENHAKGMLQVLTPLKGSPAYRAGLKTGDLISTIIRTVDPDGNALPKPEVISTKGMTTADAVKTIQGKPGTKIKLLVEREGEAKPLEFEVSRDVIELESVLGAKRKDNDEWEYVIDPANKICYVRVKSFARNTARDLLRVVSKLSRKGINGLILDLRFNPGGLLTSAVEISDMFIDDGLIVTIKPRTGLGREAAYRKELEDNKEKGATFVNFPMVCLVNGGSASGSEIVAACLQDHRRAIILGERSYGKGSVQNIQPFEGGELKLTTASFWRPSGKNLNKSSTSGKESEDWGVRPTTGYAVALSERERDQLYEHQSDLEIIPRRDLPPKEKKTDFKDRQLEMALDYLRSQIKTASKVPMKRAG
jgi:C-terminal peptidase prc